MIGVCVVWLVDACMWLSAASLDDECLGQADVDYWGCFRRVLECAPSLCCMELMFASSTSSNFCHLPARLSRKTLRMEIILGSSSLLSSVSSIKVISFILFMKSWHLFLY